MDTWVYDDEDMGLGEEKADTGFWSGLSTLWGGWTNQQIAEQKAKEAAAQAQIAQSQSTTQMIMAQLQNKKTMATLAVVGLGLVGVLFVMNRSKRRR